MIYLCASVNNTTDSIKFQRTDLKKLSQYFSQMKMSYNKFSLETVYGNKETLFAKYLTLCQCLQQRFDLISHRPYLVFGPRKYQTKTTIFSNLFLSNCKDNFRVTNIDFKFTLFYSICVHFRERMWHIKKELSV